MAPVVDGLASEFEGKVAVRKYNVDTNEAGRKLAEKYEVQFVPTFVFLDANGKVVDKIVGEASEDTLRKALENMK